MNDQELIHEQYKRVLAEANEELGYNNSMKKERFTNTPEVGARYLWNNSLVEVLDIDVSRVEGRETVEADGQVETTPARDSYSVTIKDVTEGGKFEGQVLKTPWTKYSFERV